MDCSDDALDDDSQEEEQPVPKRLVAFAIFFLMVFIMVAGYF